MPQQFSRSRQEQSQAEAVDLQSSASLSRPTGLQQLWPAGPSDPIGHAEQQQKSQQEDEPSQTSQSPSGSSGIYRCAQHVTCNSPTHPQLAPAKPSATSPPESAGTLPGWRVTACQYALMQGAGNAMCSSLAANCSCEQPAGCTVAAVTAATPAAAPAPATAAGATQTASSGSGSHGAAWLPGLPMAHEALTGIDLKHAVHLMSAAAPMCLRAYLHA